MNITELARILKITPNELRSYLPQLGFDIGVKAIKINKNVANKIIKQWPRLRRQIEDQKRFEQEKELAEKKANQVIKKIEVPSTITVRDFSKLADVPINAILSELMKNGIFASLNEKIDYDTVWLIGEELGLEITPKKESEQKSDDQENKLKDILDKENDESMLGRPPVIVVMGHVDHGKTRLLDAIRTTNVIEDESGGITQHIGAYQVTRRKQLITFIDTPGHEAFTAMRSRGAKIADVAILVVAADDGVKPQTTEAFRIIEAAKVPYVVAINKIDKPDANVDKTKQELSNMLNIIPEDWGGKTVCVPISAKEGTGITDLLDMVLLASETETENLKANPESSAVGTVIESHVDKGSGPVATILVQNGTLTVGDQLILNNINIGKVRALNNYMGGKVEKALPSTPVQIIGLKTAPTVGDIIQVGDGKKIRHKKIKNVSASQSSITSADTNNDENVKKVNVIIKSDVLGSAEAIEESLLKINTGKVKVKVLNKGLGNITDGDIKQAEAANGLILGFHVKVPPQIEELARERKVSIKLYDIIYDLINDIKEKMQDLVEATIVKKEVGKLEVKAIFKTEKDKQIIGGKIITGAASLDNIIEVERNDEKIARGKLIKLQSGKQDVTSVETDQECGILYEGNPIIEENDILVFYTEEKTIDKI